MVEQHVENAPVTADAGQLFLRKTHWAFHRADGILDQSSLIDTKFLVRQLCDATSVQGSFCAAVAKKAISMSQHCSDGVLSSRRHGATHH